MIISDSRRIFREPFSHFRCKHFEHLPVCVTAGLVQTEQGGSFTFDPFSILLFYFKNAVRQVCKKPFEIIQ